MSPARPAAADHLSIPRRDLDANGVYAFPGALRLLYGVSALFLIALAAATVFYAVSGDPGGGRREVWAVLATLLVGLAGYVVSVLGVLWDRVETTDDALRYVSRWGRSASAPWSTIEAIRFRPFLQRFDVAAYGLWKPIRLELQLERIEELLMVVAERTFHLSEHHAVTAGGGKRRLLRGIDAAGVITRKGRVEFSDIADLRILSVRSSQLVTPLLAARLRDGSWAPLHVGGRDLVEWYRRVRRAHLDWLERSGEALPPLPVVVGAGVGAGGGAFRVLLALAGVVLAAACSVVLRDPSWLTRLWEGPSAEVVAARAAEDYHAGRFAEAAARAESYFASHEPSPESLKLLDVQASSYAKLGRRDDAIAAYERALPVVREMDDVRAEPYGSMFYAVGMLYDERGDTERAARTLEEGLRIRPQSSVHRALLASFDEELGEREKAIRVFQDVLASAPSGSEAYAVARAHLAGLGVAVGGRPLRDEIAGAELTPSRGILLLPLNDVDPRLDLGAICLVLEMELRMRCLVTRKLEVEEESLLGAGRDQYDAAKVLLRLGGVQSRSQIPVFKLAVTSRDIFAGDARFLFSSSSSPEGAVGVVSSHRLVEFLPRYWPPEALVGRRVAIQALSAVGNGLGFPRPTSQRCPLAYVNGLWGMLQKGARLCASTREARDALLAGLEGAPLRFDAQRSAAVERVYTEYLLDDGAAVTPGGRP